MKTTRRGDILLLSVLSLFGIIRSSHQTVYSCNSNASCGCSTNSATVIRIVGGENANSATWGWAVSISIGNTYLCGGSIISSSWVVTAAHCVHDGYTASQITIFAGSTTRFVGTQTRVGSQLIIHSGYNPNTYVNDIALLQLASPLIMSDPYVSAICLPSISSSILSAGEWPAANTTVSNSFSYFVLYDVCFEYCSIGCCRWMGYID
jgi:secreted trypsin-like serine protease